MYAEYVGLTSEALSLIEQFRASPSESRSEILIRALSQVTRPELQSGAYLDLGQGAQLRIGETPILYLSEDAKRWRKADAIAEVRADGFYLDGRKIRPSKGSVLQPAMKLVQERKGHRNSLGELISLSAWRQWYVIRDGKLLSMFELKDPALARRRSRSVVLNEDQQRALAEALGL